MQEIYVIGHKQPDTDSIGSVIGYAELLNSREPGRYIAACCGEVNAESAYALSRFGMDTPVFVESVEPNVGDIPFFYTQKAPADMPTIDVAAMMDEQDVRNIPVTDGSGRLLGIVSEYGLAKAYVTPNRRETLSIGPIPLTTLARILDARVCNTGAETLHGRVAIVIDALHMALSRLTGDDVAVVGDNEPVQLALISAGIAALIVAEGAPVGDRALEAAKEKGVAILASPLDAFSVGRMVHLSLPAGEVVASDVPVLRPEDSLAYAKKVVTDSRYRTACIVDGDDRLLGMISRNTFLEEIQKQVILLDHNEYAQAVDGIETAEILEVIDHHRLGAITTLKPVKFLNEPVGSTSTIITGKFRDAGVTPSPAAAGMLLSGILSDTLVLKMSTTTPRDIEAVEYLAGVTGLDPVEYGTTLIQQGMELDSVPLHELMTRDTKPYTLFGKDLIIAQVMTASGEYALGRAAEIRKNLDLLRKENGVDIYLCLFTNVIENRSALFASADNSVLTALDYDDQPVILDGVMSRKKDFLPGFGNRLRNL
ncbi:MAG TPA: putative manganese-dependent inorganic diphosphatase [Methanoregulaceae archaeon]|nr:putative manganese-dependent inorganic diphosphatase [Methanolinea sp.]MDD3091143.1 putative manganese-dependent inorganic diphosphatase [Methanoregulaceae archaeon]MDD5047704.1 putative manganese-dependent inorganic diphosphatase [Methanoregulaceae archaeon]MDD5685174.1 putative manganese-dependent inorganic diphosphatase [Methanoregulaceae archaeon]HOP67175.1 putative manganese-dependent inorganic diphosphatase [Methanoregulaceae archaeon]